MESCVEFLYSDTSENMKEVKMVVPRIPTGRYSVMGTVIASKVSKEK